MIIMYNNVVIFMKNYNVERIIDSINNRGYSNFINQVLLKDVKGKLRKNEYKIYNLYEDCNKVILYKKDIPLIKLFKIDCKVELRHQDIMGTIYSLGTNDDMFGDIIKIDNSYYLLILPSMEEYFKYNLVEVKHQKINLIEEDLSILNRFKQEYDILEYNVSSLRIDNIVSSITKCSRNKVLEYFNNEDVLLNYEVVKNTRELNINDVFSIRRYGKYKYNGIKKYTKKGFIVEILMYR